MSRGEGIIPNLFIFPIANFLISTPGPLHRGAGERGSALQDQDPLLLPRPVQGHPPASHREELSHLLPGTTS
jgi:hypothetical protein